MISMFYCNKTEQWAFGFELRHEIISFHGFVDIVVNNHIKTKKPLYFRKAA